MQNHNDSPLDFLLHPIRCQHVSKSAAINVGIKKNTGNTPPVTVHILRSCVPVVVEWFYGRWLFVVCKSDNQNIFDCLLLLRRHVASAD